MKPVPKVDGLDVSFGNIKHMPKYQDVPQNFKDHHDPYHKIVSNWFFQGLDESKIKAREGVDRRDALLNIKAILRSYEPKHEHKIAGCAMLLAEWFELT